jgi:hypothetical protein
MNSGSAEGELNPFPGYPVVSIQGQVEWTAPTFEIGEIRKYVNEYVSGWHSSGPTRQPVKPSS